MQSGSTVDEVDDCGTKWKERLWWTTRAQHQALRGQKKARAGREARIQPHGEVPNAPYPQPELFNMFEEEPGGSRPPCLGEPQGPQVGVQRHIVEHIIHVLPCVQILDVSVQVIAVPREDRIPQRFVDRRRPQKAEQLVDVPTDPTYALLVIASTVLMVGASSMFSPRTEFNSTAVRRTDR